MLEPSQQNENSSRNGKHMLNDKNRVENEK